VGTWGGKRSKGKHKEDGRKKKPRNENKAKMPEGPTKKGISPEEENRKNPGLRKTIGERKIIGIRERNGVLEKGRSV